MNAPDDPKDQPMTCDIAMHSHAGLRHRPTDRPAIFLGQGWWTFELLRPVMWHLEQIQQARHVFQPGESIPDADAQAGLRALNATDSTDA